MAGTLLKMIEFTLLHNCQAQCKRSSPEVLLTVSVSELPPVFRVVME